MNKAKYTGTLSIAGNNIQCAVLDNEVRIVNGTNVLKAFGRKQMGQSKHVGLSPILTSKKLELLVREDEVISLQPVTYIGKNGKQTKGYPAEVIQVICEVYLRARSNNALSEGQIHLADQAEIIVRSLAKTAITALIDEATGFQYEREQDALQKILSAYINEDFMTWQRTFPRSFYRELFRLCGWEYNPNNVARPAYLGRLTNKYVYELMPQGVLDELRKVTPVGKSGKRTRRFHQHLKDPGRIHLERHLTKIITLMEISADFNQLDGHVNKVFRDIDQLSFDLKMP